MSRPTGEETRRQSDRGKKPRPNGGCKSATCPAFPRGVGMVRLPTLARGAGGDSATAGQGRGFYAKGDAESEKTLQESYLFEVLALSEE